MVSEEAAMGKLIVFYVPANFKAPTKMHPSPAKGKILAWNGAAVKESA
ncbi:MAG TPA: hypothetical protein VFP71_08545 [Candidatus Angelobacter sp.]|nr:hypothetical protein [Candidatus Angelobacter sp.]